MSRRSRILLIIGGSLVALVIVLAVTGVIVARSDWFRELVRARIVNEVQKATGGRAEVASFSFDWRRLRAEVRNFVLHGSEPAGSPPLFQAKLLQVDLKIVSVFKKAVDIASLVVEQPHVFVMVFPDGRTNVP